MEKINLQEQEPIGTKEFETRDGKYGGTVQATEIKLNNPDAKPGTMGWLSRFSLITTGETAKKWSSINSSLVEGVLDDEGNWIADFDEPVKDAPTKF